MSKIKSLFLATAYAEDSRLCGTDFYEYCTVRVCDCHYGLYNVNPQNVVGHCLELLQSVYLTCPVSAASACPVYSRLVAALTYVANIKSFRSLHLQSRAPLRSSHILHKIPLVENGQKQHHQEFALVQICLNSSTLHFLIKEN